MLSFPVVDTHVHFWDTNKLKYAWLEGNPRLNKPFLPEDFTQETSGAHAG